MARDDHNGKKPRHKGSGIILRALGAIFVLVICMQFLYLPDKDERPLTVSAPLVAGSPEFMTALSRLIDAPIERGEAVTPIDDGAQFEPILLKALDAASSSIDFTTYPWANGAFSNSVFAALTRAASRGVEVRVLIDALGGHTTPNNLIAALRAAGGKVAIYHPFSILDPMQFDSRDHVRSIVVDGKVGFLGGIGIGDIWLGDGVSKGWSDMMFQVQRTMAESLQSAFAEVWNETTGEVIAGPLIYPPISAAETARETNQFIHVVSVPSDSYQPIRDTYLLSIGSAKKTLDIVNGFAVPDQGTLDMIETAAKSGIAVRMLTPGPSTYAPILRYAWEGGYDALLKAGVRIFEYKPEMIHTKLLIADGVWSIIGSANLDSRSDLLNDENVMGIADPKLATALEQVFEKDLANSTEITLSAWQGRSVLEKGFTDVRAQFVLLFAKQL